MQFLMKDELIRLAFGAVCAEEHDGYLRFLRATKEQIELFNENEFYKNRMLSSSSIVLEFWTEGQEFSFDYRFPIITSFDSVDVYIGDMMFQTLRVKDLEKEGRAVFNLPVGKKKVTLYFPMYATMEIRRVFVDGGVTPAQRRGKKVLMLGDSITQGYGVGTTSHSYANTFIRTLHLRAINQGLSSYYHDAAFLRALDGFEPDVITVALGTNDHKNPELQKNVAAYYARIREAFPNTPIMTILPLFRCDGGEDKALFAKMKKILREEAKRYAGVYVVDGGMLLPNYPEYFMDGLHPNALGGTVMGQNLALVFKELFL